MDNRLPLRLFSVIIILVALGIAGYFVFSQNQAPPAPNTGDSIEYKNTNYGFSVALPKTWEGYSVTVDTWSGYAPDDQLGEVPAAQGPVVSMHNPKWTAEKPYQDIPIMVFTLRQWSDLQANKFHVGAAPIGPSELGRNSKYVFALPARYNYGHLPGYEEVEQILQGKPLTAF